MRLLPKLMPLALLLIAAACNPQPDPGVEQVIDHTEQHFAPDSRVALFDISAARSGDSWLLKGETNLPGAKAALLDSLSTLELPVTDSINVLPASGLEGQ